MVRTLAVAICTGVICLALAGCGDDPGGGDLDIIERPRDAPEPRQRVPGSGAPPSGDIGVDESATPDE